MIPLDPHALLSPKDLEEETQGTTSSGYLRVDSKDYYVVGCELMLFKMMDEYVAVAEMLNMGVEVLNRCVELLKVFLACVDRTVIAL